MAKDDLSKVRDTLRKKPSALGDYGELVIHSFIKPGQTASREVVARISNAEPVTLLTFSDINIIGRETPFRVWLPVGEYTLTAEFNSQYGLLTSTETIEIKSNKETKLDFIFKIPYRSNVRKLDVNISGGEGIPPEPPYPTPPELSVSGYIHGHVTDMAGSPLNGAFVSLVGGDLAIYNSLTNRSGYYRINLGDMSGEFRVRTQRASYKTKVKKVQRARKEKYQVLDFKLEKATRGTPPGTPPPAGAPPGSTSPGRVWGSVTDNKKRPIPGARVAIPSLGIFADTNASGYYEILNVDARGSLQITATATGFNTGRQNISRANRDESTGPIDFELKQIGAVPIPTRISISTGIPFNKIVGSLTSIILGLIASAMLGNPWFFFGFLFIGGSIVLPDTQEISQVRRLMSTFRTRNTEWINMIQRDNTMSEAEKIKAINEAVETEKNALQVEKLVRELMQSGDRLVVNIKVIFKHLLKALGIGSFVFALVNTGIPFSNIIALIAAFVGYFAIGGSRIPSTNQTQGEAT